MESQYIKTFLKVAKYTSFSKAAEELHITQPTVSRQISALEELWGLELFIRNSKEVRLTAQGLVMLERCKEIEKLISSALREANEIQVGDCGQLRIGCLEGMAYSVFVDPMVNEFCSKYPNIHIELITRSFSELQHKLDENELDIIFTLDFELNRMIEVEYELYCSVQGAFLVSNKHQLYEKENLAFSDLKGQTFFVTSPEESNGGNHLEWLLKEMGVENYRILYQPNLESCMINVRAGKGVGISDTSTRCIVNEDKRFRSLKIPKSYWDISIICAWKRNNSNPAIKLYIEAIRNLKK